MPIVLWITNQQKEIAQIDDLKICKWKTSHIWANRNCILVVLVVIEFESTARYGDDEGHVFILLKMSESAFNVHQDFKKRKLKATKYSTLRVKTR